MSQPPLFRVGRFLVPLAVTLLSLGSVRAQGFDALLEQAAVEEAAGRLEQALTLVDEAIKANPKRLEGHKARAQILQKLGRWPEADESLDIAAKIVESENAWILNFRAAMRSQADALCDRAENAMQRRDWDEAKDLLLKAQELAPNMARIAALLRGLPEQVVIDIKQTRKEREDAQRVREMLAQQRQESRQRLAGATSVSEIRAEMDRSGMSASDPGRQKVERDLAAGQLDDAKETLNNDLDERSTFDPAQLLSIAEASLEKGDLSGVATAARRLASNRQYVREAMRYAMEIRQRSPQEAGSIYEVVIAGKGEFADEAVKELAQLSLPAPRVAPEQPVVDASAPRGVAVPGRPWIAHGGIRMHYVPPQSFDSATLRARTEVAQGYWVADRRPTRQEWLDIMQVEVWPTHGTLSGGSMDDLVLDGITYGQAVKFCELLTEQDRNLLPPGYRYALPTEVEYELAHRVASFADADRRSATGSAGHAWEWCQVDGKVWVARSMRSGLRETGTNQTWTLPPGSTFRFVVAPRDNG